MPDEDMPQIDRITQQAWEQRNKHAETCEVCKNNDACPEGERLFQLLKQWAYIGVLVKKEREL